MEIPVFSFVAYSNTGKTTFIEKLIPVFRSRGLRVAVIKHDAHKFDIDHQGKDSWRFSHAGAEMSLIMSGDKFALVEQRPVELVEAIDHIHDVDIILTEGCKTGPYPKIGVFRSDSGNPLAAEPEQLLAIVADEYESTETPVFPLDNPQPLADFLIEKIKEGLPC